MMRSGGFIGLIGLVMTANAADLVHARDVVECSAMRGGGNAGYWSWRELEGRKCWYVGRPGKPKSELYWGEPVPGRASVKVEQLQAGVPTPPEPAAVLAKPGEFDKAWNDLLSDMAMPHWRWRQPISDQRLWSSEHD